MQLHFPDIADHDVSPISGFLPPQPPLTRLSEYYTAWDDLAERLAESIASKSIRIEVDALPVLSASKLTTKPQLHRAFVVLGFLVHAYIWCEGSDLPEPNVPPQLAEPYLKVCERLGMQPTLSYAGLCLWNWTLKSKGHKESNGDTTRMEDLGRLEDLDCLVSFTGTRDEAVFYVVPIMVEAKGGRLVNLLFEAMKAAVQGDVETVVSALEETRDTLPRMSALVKLLHEQCDAKVFFDIVRPFFPGAKGLEEKGMPDGVVFHQSDGSKVCARCVGGSAAQSSDFQFLDAALGVRHRPVGAATGETVFEVSTIQRVGTSTDVKRKCDHTCRVSIGISSMPWRVCRPFAAWSSLERATSVCQMSTTAVWNSCQIGGADIQGW